jgi:hypothetical protein
MRLRYHPTTSGHGAASVLANGAGVLARVRSIGNGIVAIGLADVGDKAVADRIIRAELTDRDEARSIRESWMREMGFSEAEIAESCVEDPPTSLDSEMRELRAARLLKRLTPPPSVLQEHAKRV